MTANITEDHYNNKFKTDNTFSVIHFSSRSLYANFDHIKSCLKQFTKPFTVILISETWINSEGEIEFFVEGYEFICMNRTKKAWWCGHECGLKLQKEKLSLQEIPKKENKKTPENKYKYKNKLTGIIQQM